MYQDQSDRVKPLQSQRDLCSPDITTTVLALSANTKTEWGSGMDCARRRPVHWIRLVLSSKSHHVSAARGPACAGLQSGLQITRRAEHIV